MLLEENQVIIQCMKTVENCFREYSKKQNTIELVGKQVMVKEIKSEHFAQIGFNGDTYCFVVPDSLLETIKAMDFKVESRHYQDNYKLVAQTKEPTTEAFYEALSNYILFDEIEQTAVIDGTEQTYKMNIMLGNVSTRGKRMTVIKSSYTIISFLAFYIALIFVMVTATILSIQQLSDSEKYKYRYELLKKLGMEEREMNRTILQQLLFYFCLPMLIPILLSFPVVLIVGQIFLIAITVQEILKNMLIVIGLFILVYGIYFVATDVQFERNINGNQ